MSELKNLFKGTLGFAVIGILVLIGLRFLASEMNAGSEGFYLSLPFLVLQAMVMVGAYVAWYRKVSYLAADMLNVSEMRKMAFRYKNRYLLISVAVTAIIAAAAILGMFVGIFFVGIPAIYCCSSVLTMGILGNAVLYILMRFLGLPDRVIGLY